MNGQSLDGLVRTANIEWMPFVERGGHERDLGEGLSTDQATGRAPSFLLRFEPDAKYPYHNHLAGKELFVLAGRRVIEGTTVRWLDDVGRSKRAGQGQGAQPLPATRAKGRDFVDDPQDMVRREIIAGLDAKVPIIPLLHGTDRMPAAAHFRNRCSG